MIKVGIYGPGTVNSPVRKQLLRFLLRHPDVDLRAVASTAGNTVPLAELHPVYAGETTLTLERVLSLDGLDVLFVIDQENLTEEAMEKFRSDSDFRIVMLGECSPMLEAMGDDDFVYGFAEYNRKALVRGARAAVSPRPEALLTELALFPLAKAGLLPADIDVAIATPTPDLVPAVEEATRLLTTVQPDSSLKIRARKLEEAPYQRLDITATMKAPVAIEEVERIYAEAYDDHNFTYVVAGEDGVDEDLRGSNKCLIQLIGRGDTLVVKASIDALTKGCTGNAVHLMNLLFGLHERTGLSI